MPPVAWIWRMAVDPPTPIAAEIAQERPHVLEQWWPEPVGVAGRQLRWQAAADSGHRAAAAPGAAVPGGPFGGRPGGPGPLPDLERLIAGFRPISARLPGRPADRAAASPAAAASLLIGLAVVALWLASGFYRVEPDEQGVVLRFGAFNRTTPPGLNWHCPGRSRAC